MQALLSVRSRSQNNLDDLVVTRSQIWPTGGALLHCSAHQNPVLCPLHAFWILSVRGDHSMTPATTFAAGMLVMLVLPLLLAMCVARFVCMRQRPGRPRPSDEVGLVEADADADEEDGRRSPPRARGRRAAPPPAAVRAAAAGRARRARTPQPDDEEAGALVGDGERRRRRRSKAKAPPTGRRRERGDEAAASNGVANSGALCVYSGGGGSDDDDDSDDDFGSTVLPPPSCVSAATEMGGGLRDLSLAGCCGVKSTHGGLTIVGRPPPPPSRAEVDAQQRRERRSELNAFRASKFRHYLTL